MDVLKRILSEKRQPLEVEVYDFLRNKGIEFLPYHYATSKEEMEEIVNELDEGKYVCKVMSPKILHKSDFKAVKLNISKNELVDLFVELEESFKKLDFQGLLVVPMAEDGVELLIGSNDDETFGNITVFGVGGTMVEIIKDVTFGKAPVSRREALMMIDDLDSQEILDGPRGLPKTDRIELADLVVKISEISDEYDAIIKEIDLNPVRVTSQGIYPLDARVILELKNINNNEVFR